MTSSLRQVLYISRASADLDDPAIKRIVAQAQLNNRRADLSGVLALGPGLFAQILEGLPDAVERTLARIQLDPRHTDIRLLADRAVSARMFDRWSMELLVDETSSSLADDVLKGRRDPQALLEHLRDQHAQDPLWWSPDLKTMALAA